MKTTIIYGSVRDNRQGIKAVNFIKRKLIERKHEVNIIDPVKYNLPFLNKMHKEYDKAPKPMEEISNILNNSDGFIIVSAEYNHSIPPALKNLLDHFQKEYLYKPSALITYSAGSFGGVRGLANLRMIMAELGASSIPSNFPIPFIQDAFDDNGKPVDIKYNDRSDKFLNEYEWYLDALKSKRKD